MVNARRRDKRFFVSLRHLNFLDCEPETSKCFEYNREVFGSPRFSWELEWACTIF